MGIEKAGFKLKNKKNSKDTFDDGYSSVAAKVAIMLGQKYIIPSIPEMRESRRYEDYF